MTKSAKKTSSWASSRKEMSKKVFKKLMGADPNLGWKLAGHQVMLQLLGLDVVPVSCPEDAACFDLGTILVKDHQSLTAKAALRHTTLRAIGTIEEKSISAPPNLRDILAPKIDNNWKAPSSGFPWSHAIGNEHGGERKRFYVKVGDVAKEVVHLTLKKGDLRLQMNDDDLRKAKSVYIVTEAFYTNSLKVEVTVDGRQGTFFTEDKILIGFRYQKFKLSKSGVVGPELSSNIRRNRDAHLFVKTNYAERLKKPAKPPQFKTPCSASVAVSPVTSLPGMAEDATNQKTSPAVAESKESLSSVPGATAVTEKTDECEVVDIDEEISEKDQEGSKGKTEVPDEAKTEDTQLDDTLCSVVR